MHCAQSARPKAGANAASWQVDLQPRCLLLKVEGTYLQFVLLLPLQGRRSKMLAAITALMMQEKLKLEGPVADNHIEQPDPSSDGDTSDDDDVELQSLTGSDADAEPLQEPAIKQEKPEVSL